MGRATGANARVCVKTEEEYGVPPEGNYLQVPFISSSLGLEQNLQADPILGRGRDPYTPQRDVKDAGGDLVVPVDQHYIGYWLAGLFGAPTTTQVAAFGSITFGGNPVNGDTITLNGVEWEFVTGSPIGNQTQVQDNLAATLAELVDDLNGSVHADIAVATYSENDTQLLIAFDTAGAGGNSYGLAASNATPSAANLSGGGYRHRFVSGSDTLPSRSIEVGHPKVPAYLMNLGYIVNSIGFSLAANGTAQATVNMIGQDELDPVTNSEAGTPEFLNSGNVDSFSQFQGVVKRNGTALGNIESGSFAYNNSLDPVRVVRPDGLISGADPGVASFTGTISARFDSTQFMIDSRNNTELELEMGYVLNEHTKLIFTAHNVRLPVRKQTVEGPAGIRASYEWIAAFDATAGRMVTVDLHNNYDGALYQTEEE